MANRHTLAIHKFGEFKEWLDLLGLEHRPTTADWQVLQVRLPGDPRWHAIYQKLHAKEHLSVPEPLGRLVQAFVNRTDPYEALAPGQRQLAKLRTIERRYGNPTGRRVEPYQPPFHNLPTSDDTPPMHTYRVDAKVEGEKLSVGVRDAASVTEALTQAVPILEKAARAFLGLNHGPVKVTGVEPVSDTPPWE